MKANVCCRVSGKEDTADICGAGFASHFVWGLKARGFGMGDGEISCVMIAGGVFADIFDSDGA